MGVDVHGFNFLKYAVSRQPLGRVVTIGRQGVHVPAARLRKLVGNDKVYGPYSEDLLRNHFSADLVQSFDNSGYEDATFIHDFNKPIQNHDVYDTVIDFGTLEHVFNIDQALANVASLCRPGGQILHALPANNFCGHGFWQFSPELFFSLYSMENGFENTSMFIADAEDERHWYAVRKPARGERCEVISHTPLTLLVRTNKAKSTTGVDVQQSDYVDAWEQNQPKAAAANPLRVILNRSPLLFGLAHRGRGLLRKAFPLRSYRTVRLSSKHQSFIKRTVAAETSGAPIAP